MNRYWVRDYRGKRHAIRARSRAAALRIVGEQFPAPPPPIEEPAKPSYTEITVTVSGPRGAGKTTFIKRVLSRALGIAGLRFATIIEDETTVPSFDRVTVKIPVGWL